MHNPLQIEVSSCENTLKKFDFKKEPAMFEHLPGTFQIFAGGVHDWAILTVMKVGKGLVRVGNGHQYS